MNHRLDGADGDAAAGAASSRDEERRVLEKTRWFDADHSDACKCEEGPGKGLEESPGKASS